MGQLRGLLADGLQHLRVGVAERVHRDPAAHVQVALACWILDPAALGPGDDDGQRMIVVRPVLLLEGDVLVDAMSGR